MSEGPDLGVPAHTCPLGHLGRGRGRRSGEGVMGPGHLPNDVSAATHCQAPRYRLSGRATTPPRGRAFAGQDGAHARQPSLRRAARDTVPAPGFSRPSPTVSPPRLTGFFFEGQGNCGSKGATREATCRALGSHQEARRKRNLPQKTVAPTVHPPPRHSSPSPAGPTWGCWSPSQLFPCCPSPGGQLPCEWGHPPFQRHPGICLQPRPLGEQLPAWLAHWGQRIPRGGSLTSPTPAPSAPPEAPCAASASARAPRG